MKRANAYDNYKQALIRKKNEELSLKITEKANNQILKMLESREKISEKHDFLINWSYKFIGHMFEQVRDGKANMETLFKYKRMWTEEMENIVGKEDKFLINLMKEVNKINTNNNDFIAGLIETEETLPVESERDN